MSEETTPKLLDSIREFMASFELVFGADWEHTKAAIEDDSSIALAGTFLEPDCGDESNNWANRGSLLIGYRRLLEVLEREGIYTSEFK